MKAGTIKPLVWFVALITVISLSCNLSTTKTPTPTPAPTVTEAVQEPSPGVEPTATSQAERSGAANSLKEVQNAVIQIEAEGTFMDPQLGLVQNGAGRGSGFIFDPSGLAVTNNHVVTGAGLLKVWVGGNTDKTYNARVLGVSECSDLAVIKIDGENFPYLEWHAGSVEVGTDIYVAGFPLGDPEYSLNKGIISKAKANGKTSRSSIQAVIQYDAATNPGNSGGPVLDVNGKVMGVHFGSIKEARQAFGISKDLAQEVIGELKMGQNLDSLGINGQAVKSDDGKISGVWVSSVQSGSPADAVGLQPGDIILKIENLVLGSDGTMSAYCDILRSHNVEDALAVQILRWDTKQILAGQFNGKALEVTADLGGQAASTTSGQQQTTPQDGNTTTPSQGEGVQVNTAASKSGEIYYQNLFQSDLQDWEYFMGKGDKENFSSSVGDGKFHIEITHQKTWVYYLYRAMTFDNVRVDTRAENVGSNTNFVALVCRYTQNDGWYEADFLSDGRYFIYLVDLKAKTNNFKTMYSGASRLINMGKAVNEYTFICDGDRLTVGVNGTEVRTIPTKTGSYRILKSGETGLAVSAEQVIPIIVDFNSFSLSVP